MWKNILGIGAGLALGAAMFAAPASASGVDFVDWSLAKDLDPAVQMCDWSGPASEITCFDNIGVTITGDDIGNIGELDDPVNPLNFLHVHNAPLLDIFGDPVFVLDEFGDPIPVFSDTIYALDLSEELVGGYWSIKTGNLTPGGENTQKIYIFQNIANFLYATFDLSILFADGLTVNDITKVSHVSTGGIPQVPLPGAALLFGSALLGGGLIRRRKVIKKLGLPT